MVRIVTFGYARRPPPHDATLVVDCRRLPDGLTNRPEATRLLQLAEDHARTHPDAVIAFGCEYGQNRSRSLAAALEKRLRDRPPSTPKSTLDGAR